MARMGNDDARRGRSRARHALAWMLGTVVAVQAAAGLWLDAHGKSLRFPQAAEITTFLRSEPSRPLVVCLGSSRFGAAIRSEEMTATLRAVLGSDDIAILNAATDAGDLLVARYVLEEILAASAPPSMVLIEILPESLARQNGWMYMHVRRQMRWRDVVSWLPELVHTRNVPKLLASRTIPLHFHRQAIQEAAARLIHGRGQNPTTAKRYPGLQTAHLKSIRASDVPPWRERQIWLPMARRWLTDYETSNLCCESLEHVLKCCKERGATVILVAPPMSAPRRKLYTPAIEQAFQLQVAAAVSRYGCCFEDWRARVPDEQFLDDHHLAREGALAFSDCLTAEVVAPAWMERMARGSSKSSFTASLRGE